MKNKLEKLHLKIGEGSVYMIKNLTGIGPENLSEIVLSLSNRDLYLSADINDINSKYGVLYVSGYQHPKIINDFYKIVFNDKETPMTIMNKYAEDK